MRCRAWRADAVRRPCGRAHAPHSYVCQDIVREFRRYDEDPLKYFERFEGEHTVTGRVSRPPPRARARADTGEQKYGVDVGYERFLAPEIFFNPEIASSDFLTPLPEVVDSVIQQSPIDVRRGLYKVGGMGPALWRTAHTVHRTLSSRAARRCLRTSASG